MNGNRYLLDTNAIIALLRGNQQVLQQLQTSEWIGISIISQLEFLSFLGLTEGDREVFEQFLKRVEVIGLDPSQSNLIELAIQLRQQSRISLPDVIIAATAMHANAALITADQQLQTIQALTVVAFVP